MVVLVECYRIWRRGTASINPPSVPLAISSTGSRAGPHQALTHPRDSSSSWVDTLRPPVGALSCVGADTDGAGGCSKRKRMKGRGKEGSAEGPFCFSLFGRRNLFLTSVSVLSCCGSNFLISICLCNKKKRIKNKKCSFN